MMSQDRRIQLNYRFLKGCVESGPVEAMQHSWADRILQMVPEHLRNAKVLHELLEDLFTEVRSNFENSMRRSMGMVLHIYFLNLILCLFVTALLSLQKMQFQ